jgi:hypothetical protein
VTARRKAVAQDELLLKEPTEGIELLDDADDEVVDIVEGIRGDVMVGAADQRLVPTGYETAVYKLAGVSPLIMHNGVLADPLSPQAKALKRMNKRSLKTDADYLLVAKTGFIHSLYYDAKLGPVIPGVNIEAMLVAAAKKRKMGPQAKAGLLCEGSFALEYEGPRDPEGLWADGRFRLTSGVVVGRGRIMRTRPRFESWAVTISIDYELTTINKTDLDEIIKLGGKIIGLGDWRPRYGRFAVEILGGAKPVEAT